MSLQLGKQLKVIKRIQETHDTVSLVLGIPPDVTAQFHYRAGQFVTFFLNVDGEPINRSYSLCTSPLVDKEFKVTVKKVPGGRGSTFLCDRVKEGDMLLTAPPAGTFFKPSLHEQGTHFVLFAAGSGITPIFSILKTVLTASSLNEVTLTYANSGENSIIYRNEIAEWCSAHPDRLHVRHILSRPTDLWKGETGRVDERVATRVCQEVKAKAGKKAREYYICGPEGFMSAVRAGLTAEGVPASDIRTEDFATSAHKPHPKVGAAINENWTVIGKAQPASSSAGAPEQIIAEINGKTVEVKAVAGKNILETLLEAGHQPPYSCMDGSCMACLAKVVEGQVYQEDLGILSEENVANHETLTCQAKPLSKLVKITYDTL